MRIAGVLTLHADPGARVVPVETLANAVAPATYHGGAAKRLVDNAASSADIADAERLRRWIFVTWPEPSISATGAAQHGPGSLRETPKVRTQPRILAAHGWVYALDGGGVVAGKRCREAWRIHGRVVS